MKKFITVEHGMCGYYICLCDDAGPIEKISCDTFDDVEEAVKHAKELAKEYLVKYV